MTGCRTPDKHSHAEVLLIIFLAICSPALALKGRTIDQLESINISGSRQWLLCRGENSDKPVVLFVHGGPGSPLMFFSRGFDGPFLKDFIVVHWDQRHSGKSFDRAKSVSDFSAEQIAKDGISVIEHLKQKFGKSKILLVGHSWGSIVGAAMVESKPSDFLAYISVGTVANMAEGDALKYAFLKHQAKLSGNEAEKASVEKLGLPPWKSFEQLVIQSRLMMKFKGSFFALSPDQINSAVSKNTEYTSSDMESLDSSMDKIWEQVSPWLFNFKAFDAVQKLEVPVFFAQGVHDMATPPILARKYFDQLAAPKGKHWVEFAGSAHFPMYEEPEKFLSLLKQAAN